MSSKTETCEWHNECQNPAFETVEIEKFKENGTEEINRCLVCKEYNEVLRRLKEVYKNADKS